MILVKPLLLLLSLSGILSLSAFSQGSGEPGDIGYVRVRLNDLTSVQQELTVDQFMRSKPGVLMSRTDRNTDVFFAHYSIASGLSEADFVNWIQSLGFHVSCVVSGTRNGEPLKDFPKDCLDHSEEHIEKTH